MNKINTKIDSDKNKSAINIFFIHIDLVIIFTGLLFFMLLLLSINCFSGIANNDYDWKVPKNIKPTPYDQFNKGIYIDQSTGFSYYVFEDRESGTQSPVVGNSVHFNRFNPATYNFDYIQTRPYLGDYSKNDYLMYNGTIYTFYAIGDTFYLKIGNQTENAMAWKNTPNDIPQFDILGLFKEKAYFIWFVDNPHRIVLFNIDLNTLHWERQELFQYGYYWQSNKNILKNGMIYIALEEGGGHTFSTIWLYKYDIDKNELLGPNQLWSDAISSYGDWDFDIDSFSF
jgi:hypothetical protein